jgi:hypothetical protein
MRKKIQRIINNSGSRPCDVCGEECILVQHHIRGRKIINANAAWNIANICPNCHAKIHNGIIILENWVQTTNGKELIWHYYKDESITGDDAKPHLFGD